MQYRYTMPFFVRLAQWYLSIYMNRKKKKRLSRFGRFANFL